jgi:hypothetical protein
MLKKLLVGALVLSFLSIGIVTRVHGWDCFKCQNNQCTQISVGESGQKVCAEDHYPDGHVECGLSGRGCARV